MTPTKRSHKDRLAKLREVFGKRQEIARNSGKKHDVSIAKICSDADVDKIYLFGHRLKADDPYRAEYLALKNEIINFQNNLSAGFERSEDWKRASELEIKYNILLSDFESLQSEIESLKSNSTDDQDSLSASRARIVELKAKIVDLESQLANAPKLTKVTGDFSTRIQKHIVSPDKFRVSNGRYQIGTPKQEAEAWGLAYTKLEELLGRNLKMRLYILVGLPCSGKTFWAEHHMLDSTRHPVIWDATNLSSIDRFRLIISLSRFEDLPKTCVYFETGMEIIRERNRTARIVEKRISDEDLTVMKSKMEEPNPYEETWIDDFIIVRHNDGQTV